eukprot:m.346771 g.346771  ORF g.346771 m.346771 type:complete len:230 (+) comp27916_c0_seq8:441-1130(+)
MACTRCHDTQRCCQTMVHDSCRSAEFSPIESPVCGLAGASRKRGMRRSPVSPSLLAERRGTHVPPAISIPFLASLTPGCPSDDEGEDTRADHITEPQRDLLFSTATGFIQSGSVSSADLHRALMTSSADDPPGASSVSSAYADSPEMWAAVEFEHFLCSVSKENVRAQPGGAEGGAVAGRAGPPVKRTRSRSALSLGHGRGPMLEWDRSGQPSGFPQSATAKRLRLEYE